MFLVITAALAADLCQAGHGGRYLGMILWMGSPRWEAGRRAGGRGFIILCFGGVGGWEDLRNAG